MEVKEKRREVHIRTTVDRYQKIKKLAEKDNRKVTAIIEIALDQYLKGRKV